MTDTIGDFDTSLDEVTEVEGETFRTFTNAVIALVGQPTSDGRMLAQNIDLSFRTFPLPLMWCKQSKEGHSDSYTVGVIESAALNGGTVVASGYLLNTAEADEAANELAHGVSSPSVDLASAEWVFTDASGVELAEDASPDTPMFMTFTKAELIGTTLVATAAFGDTKLSLNENREPREVALVASAAEEFRPKVYDHRLFENPNLPGPTLPTMGADGRIVGHLAVFGQCHRSVQTECVMVPRSPSDYTHFHTSPAIRLDNGQRLPVGRLTVGTGHADPRLGAAPAAAHYDNTGSCFALVRVGEDAHGIWFSGVAAPWATPDQVEQGVSSPLSGDWRNFGQGLDLVAALAVNTPGFSARGRDDDQGQPLALVASVGPVVKPGHKHTGLTRSQIKEVVLEALLEESERKNRAIETMAAIIRAEKLVGKPPTVRERVRDLLAGFSEGNTPPPAVRAEARRGLKWRDEFNRGGTAVGVARARDLSNGKSISSDTISRMNSYFARHEVDKKGKGWSPGSEGYPSAGRIAWALWGGDAGRSWSASVSKKNKKEN